METHLPRMYSLVLCCFSTALQRPAKPPTAFCRRRRRLYVEQHMAERAGTEAEIDSMDDTLAIWLMMMRIILRCVGRI